MTARRTRSTGATARLRELLASRQTILAPGAFDPLAARCVEEAGFDAVYMTGFGTAAAMLGRPDVGLATMTEMVDNAARIVACVDIPVIADIRSTWISGFTHDSGGGCAVSPGRVSCAPGWNRRSTPGPALDGPFG